MYLLVSLYVTYLLEKAADTIHAKAGSLADRPGTDPHSSKTCFALAYIHFSAAALQKHSQALQIRHRRDL